MGWVQKGLEGSAWCKLCQGASKSSVFGGENNAADNNWKGEEKYHLSTKLSLSDEYKEVGGKG